MGKIINLPKREPALAESILTQPADVITLKGEMIPRPYERPIPLGDRKGCICACGRSAELMFGYDEPEAYSCRKNECKSRARRSAKNYYVPRLPADIPKKQMATNRIRPPASSPKRRFLDYFIGPAICGLLIWLADFKT